MNKHIQPSPSTIFDVLIHFNKCTEIYRLARIETLIIFTLISFPLACIKSSAQHTHIHPEHTPHD